ncbi:hypothetical protein B0T13DRAFT_449503 [Neurospora crassa]|nr:hypothetical protein B0T13DRAFT_449503 [Neurospora crassa]
MAGIPCKCGVAAVIFDLWWLGSSRLVGGGNTSWKIFRSCLTWRDVPVLSAFEFKGSLPAYRLIREELSRYFAGKKRRKTHLCRGTLLLASEDGLGLEPKTWNCAMHAFFSSGSDHE